MPVLKANCTNNFNKIKVDVTIQDPRHNGLKCVQLVKDYLREYESLRYLVLPLKQLIYYAELNDPYQGGITSYGIILMIVAFLQFKVKNIESIQNKKPNLGKLFIEFLNLYMNLDYSNTEICPLKPNDKSNSSDPFVSPQFPHSQFYIKDPLNSQNNVSRSAHRFMFMRVSFDSDFQTTFYYAFFNCFTLSRCEIRDIQHLELANGAERSADVYRAIQPRNYVLYKIFHSVKTHAILMKDQSVLKI